MSLATQQQPPQRSQVCVDHNQHVEETPNLVKCPSRKQPSREQHPSSSLVQEAFVLQGSSAVTFSKLCNVLDHVVAHHRDQHVWQGTAFHALRAPQISLSNYCKRLVEGFECSEEVMLMALVYIMRLEQRLGHGVLCALSSHRMVLISFVIAIKFHEDINVNTAYVASVGGVTPRELCRLEAEFLRMLDFRAMVTETEFEALKRGLFKAKVAQPQQQPHHPLRQSY